MDQSGSRSTDPGGRGLGVCCVHQQLQRNSAPLAGTAHKAGGANGSGFEGPNHEGTLKMYHSPDRSVTHSVLLELE